MKAFPRTILPFFLAILIFGLAPALWAQDSSEATPEIPSEPVDIFEPTIEATVEPVVEATVEPTVEAPVEVTAEPTTEIPPVTTEAPPIITPPTDTFVDGFENGAAWSLVGWQVIDGTLSTSDANASATLIGVDWAHLLFSAEISLPAGSAVGVVLRSSAENYIVGLESSGRTTLSRSGVLLAESAPVGEINGWRTLQIQALGGLITAAVDGVVQFSYDDSPGLSAGAIGFLSGGAVAVDNVTIIRLDAPTVVVVPTEAPTEAPTAEATTEIIIIEPTIEATEIAAPVDAPPVINGLAGSYDAPANEAISLNFSVTDDADLVAISANTEGSAGKIALSAVSSSAAPFITHVTVQYFPAEGFSGVDQFTINATDFAGNVVSAGVQVNVAEPLAQVAESSLFSVIRYTFDNDELVDMTLRPGWSVVNGALQASNTAAAADIVTNFSDGAIQADVLLNSGSFNLTFRQNWQDLTSTGYTAVFRAGEAALYRNGALLASAPATIPGEWHTVRVNADGGDLSIEIDGQVVVTAVDTEPLPAGTISMTAPETVIIDESVPSAIVQVDNVEIWAASTVAPSALPNDVLPAPPGSANIGDRVWIDTNSDGLQTGGEVGLANVTVYVYQYINSTTSNYVTLAITDVNGNFQFNVPSGFNYFLRIDVPDGYILTNPNVGSYTANSDFDPVSFTTNYTFLSSTEDDYSWDAGLVQLSACQEDTALDIMLVLDGSSSIYSSDFKLMQNFAAGLVQSFTLGENQARFGVIQFSTPGTGRQEIGLSTNETTVLARIRAMSQINGSTDIGEGLRMAQNELQRDGRDVKLIPRAIVLLTDGVHNGDEDELTRQIRRAKNAKTLIYGIAVGSGPDLIQIREIASDPDSRFVFTITNFSGLVQSLRAVANSTCNTPLIPYLGPELLTPVNNGFVNDNTPTFTWGSVPFTSDRYDGFFTIQVDNNQSFGSPEYVSTVPGLTDTPIGSLPDGRYFWRVLGGNVLGAGPWSRIFRFTIDTIAPATPVQVSPADNAVTSNARPSFTWRAAAGASVYHLQIDNNADFSSPLYNETALTSTSFKPPVSLPQNTFSWRVRAIDAAGNTSPWSTPRTVSINIMLTPADNFAFITNVPGQPTFTWAAVPGAVGYQINVATSPGFAATTIYAATTTATSFKIPANHALAYGVYYWRVNLDMGSGFAPPPFNRRLMVTPPAPPKPVLVSPAHLEYLNTAAPTLTWNAVVYDYAGVGINYEVQVDNNSTFASPERTTTTAGLSYLVSPVLPDGSYYWRVRAVNSLGFAGQYTTARRFTIDTVAPAAPLLNTPTDGATVSTARPQVKWFASAGANRYQVQIDNNSNFASPEVSIFPVTNTSLTSPTSLPQGLYYWRVQAADAAGNFSAWSDVRTLNINIMLTPAANAFVISTTGTARPTFTWAAVTGAVGYQIAIATTPSFGASTIYAFSLTTTSHQIPVPNALAYGTYYWQVNLNLGSGIVGSPYSRQITITPPAPPAPTLLTPPNNNSTNDSTPTFTWNPPLYTYSTVSYEIQISRNNTFTNLVTTATIPTGTTSYTAPVLLPGTYYWRLRSINNVGYAGSFGSGRQITILP